MDLKASNIMIRSSGTAGRGIVAKVADFGLSVSLDSMQTHMSSMFQGASGLRNLTYLCQPQIRPLDVHLNQLGTITHMAPEILLHGRVSKAADVYAFGITMWEVMTGEQVGSFIDTQVLLH